MKLKIFNKPLQKL